MRERCLIEDRQTILATGPAHGKWMNVWGRERASPSPNPLRPKFGLVLFFVLRDGVIEGRRVFANVVKYIRMGASCTFGNMLSVVGASAFCPSCRQPLGS